MSKVVDPNIRGQPTLPLVNFLCDGIAFWGLTKQAKTRFRLGIFYVMALPIGASLNKRRLDFDLDSLGYQDRPSPSLRMKETCMLKMIMKSD